MTRESGIGDKGMTGFGFFSIKSPSNVFLTEVAS